MNFWTNAAEALRQRFSFFFFLFFFYVYIDVIDIQLKAVKRHRRGCRGPGEVSAMKLPQLTVWSDQLISWWRHTLVTGRNRFFSRRVISFQIDRIWSSFFPPSNVSFRSILCPESFLELQIASAFQQTSEIFDWFLTTLHRHNRMIWTLE